MTKKLLKPKLMPNEIVAKMKELGITFKYTSEYEAELYLSNVNNYLRTACYRKNFAKRQTGSNIGTYLDLDFDYLKDLSTIDMHLRYLVIKMCIEIEHSLKQKLVYEIDNNPDEDGYSIVKEYISLNSKAFNDLTNNISSGYTYDLASKYLTIKESIDHLDGIHREIVDYDNCPVWVYVEMISFGQFLRFYDYCKTRVGFSGIDMSLVNCVRSLRNAAAHNNCLLSDLSKKTTKPPREIVLFQNDIPELSKLSKSKKMRNRTIMEFVTLLYLYKQNVSETIQKYRIKELKDLFKNRIPMNANYYKNNSLLKSIYTFVSLNIDYLYGI